MPPPTREKKTSAAWPGSLLLFGLLLVAPGWAVYRSLGANFALYAAGGLTAISLLTFGLYGFDKRRATRAGERTPEAALHVLELLGGWPGAFLAQRFFRHKTVKVRFQLVFWFIVLLYQIVSLDYLMGWPVTKAAVSVLTPAR